MKLLLRRLNEIGACWWRTVCGAIEQFNITNEMKLPLRRLNEKPKEYKARCRAKRSAAERQAECRERKKRRKINEKRKKNRNAKRREREASEESAKFDWRAYVATESTFASSEKIEAAILNFESAMNSVGHKNCLVCKRTGLGLDMSSRKDLCSDCELFGYDERDLIEENLLPVWFDSDNRCKYHVPPELSELRDHEKVLIQRIHTHVPAHHVKYGVLGIKGHVCAFPQDVGVVCRILPRLPSDCNVVKFVKETTARIVGGTEKGVLVVRKNHVLRALRWLRIHHVGYKDIVIAEENLNWMGDNEEMELPAAIDVEACTEEENVDAGPSPAVNVDPMDEEEEIYTTSAVYMETSPTLASEEDRLVATAINSAAKSGSVTFNWPTIGEQAVSELSSETVFTLAFPWLFPGGVGDLKDARIRKLTPQEWAKRMMMYSDGRFATDRVFCFYLLNYVTRRRNMNSGNFFINKFSKDESCDLETLCQAIADGDNTFINDITYFSREIRGSDGYWRAKKDQLNTWISHHVEMDNGLPNFFITLSCAEYMWKDIRQLVEERIFIATGSRFKFPDGKKGRVQMINDYALVVQEYFQIRVKEWLRLIGKDLFGIKHYWVRYEFAPSRGQIHAHMLCISEDQSMNQAMYELRRDGDAQADALSHWCKEKLGLTACHDSSLFEVDVKEASINPVCHHYGDSVDKTFDIWGLTEMTEIHNCNGYCLRAPSSDEKKQFCRERNLTEYPPDCAIRVCRFGAGFEKTAGTGDTEGFKLSSRAYFVRGASGFKKLKLERNHRRVNQFSKIMLSSWRANCDVQVLVYESNPKRPRFDEIARVTDYVVGYACKGGERLKDEKKQLVELANTYCDKYSEDGTIRNLANKMLNRAATNRFISKPECVVLLMELALVLCSDKFTQINLSGYARISKSGVSCNNWLKQYEKRPKALDSLTFHQYFHFKKDQYKGMDKPEWDIPIYTGMHTKAVFPVTMKYTQFVFKVHKAWRDRREYEMPAFGWKDRYNAYINSSVCPAAAKFAYLQAVERHNNSALDRCVVSSAPELDRIEDRIDADPDLIDLINALGLTTVDDFEDSDDLKYNYGKNYDWVGNNTTRINVPDGSDWLLKTVAREQELTVERRKKGVAYDSLDLPRYMSSSGEYCDYEISNLNKSQADVMAYILHNIKSWLEKDPRFEPIQMIISGEGGTGKTVLLKTITSVIRRMFCSDTSAVVSGPTGACSCHAGGKTDHKSFILSGNLSSFDVSRYTQEALETDLYDTIVCLFDERSMRESKVIGKMEITCRMCAHGRRKTETPWGGIPIVIQIGDDYQLPSFGNGVLYIRLPGYEYCHPPIETRRLTLHGHGVHFKFSQNVMKLSIQERQSEGEGDMKGRLERARKDELTVDDVNLFKRLHINNHNIDKNSLRERLSKALYVFANTAPKIEHNRRRLKETSDYSGNPVAVLRARYTGGPGRINKPVRWHFAERNSNDVINFKTPERCLICVGCKVSVCGRNLCPEWGLFNGAMGTVTEIHFRATEDNAAPNPNNGDMCSYVVVNFPGYKGPVWDKKEPKCVPIPVVTERCSKGCCTKHFIPLELCFATTIHKVQGLTVGPSKEGREPNAAELMVIDVGSRDFEMRCPGLFYTGYSRATTDGDGDYEKSAILFMGDNITTERLIGMTVRLDGKTSLLGERRHAWVDWLDRHTHTSELSDDEKRDLFEWSRNFRMSRNDLLKHIGSSGVESSTL